MTADPLAAWRSFLASPAAPRSAMSPLELDGYLTGIVVTPRAAPILPSEWLPGVWGAEEPVFDDDKQATAALGAIMQRYNALSAGIDASLKRLEATRACDWRPTFLGEGKPAHDAVRSWVHGFWKAMALAPQVWSALAGDERTRAMIAPFVGFVDLGEQHAFDLCEDADAVLDADAAAIPQTVLVCASWRRSGTGRQRPSAGPRSAATTHALADQAGSTSAAAARIEPSTDIGGVLRQTLTDKLGLRALIVGAGTQEFPLSIATSIRELPRSELGRLTQIDCDREMTFVVVGASRILGAVHALTDPDNCRAEFRIRVRADLAGKGLGRLLLDKLIRYLRDRDTGEAAGECLTGDDAMRALAHSMGFRIEAASDAKTVFLRLDLRKTHKGAGGSD